LQLLT